MRCKVMTGYSKSLIMLKQDRTITGPKKAMSRLGIDSYL